MKNSEWLAGLTKKEFGKWLCEFRDSHCPGCPMEEYCIAADYYIDGMTNWLDMEHIEVKKKKK